MSGNENSPAASDKTDPPSPSVNNGSEVTESGTADFVENWIDGKCVFCKQELKDGSEPKLLQCLHTACKSCLTSESVPSPSTSTTSVQSAKQLTCPACSQEVNSGEVIDHLFLLEHLSKSAEGQVPEESKIYTCTSCEEGANASAFCLDCQEWLCETCVSAHHRVRVTKDHVIRQKDEMEGEKTSGLSQKYLFCPVHSHEQLKLYCETCDKLTCRDCQLSDHKDHKYQFLSKACEDEKQHFSSLLAKIKEKQTHIERACNLVNQRHVEITQREQAVTQEVKTFAVKFITEINRRGKQLLQELNDVCTNKKNQLSFKNQELANMGQRLEHCMKFSESAVAHGSDVALVYSKKLIMSQLRRILRHRCEVPDLQHMVDIQFTYESNFLTNYISQLGCLLVDQRPVGGVLPGQQQNRNNPMMQMASQNPNTQQGNQVQGRGHVIPQAPTAVNQRAMPVQQINHNPPQRQQGSLYGQPQVTSSTHPAQNPTNQIRHINPNNQISYTRNPNQNAMNAVQQQQQNQAQNFRASSNVTYTQRPVQQNPGNTTVRQQQVVQQQQQQQSQTFQQTPLPVPLVGNSSITISAVAGPTPPKQRAVAPRANMQLIPVNQQADSPSKRLQNTGNQQPQQRNTPQVIVIDDAPSAPKMTMSNTSRLTHFPSGTTGSSGVQIQPVNFNSSGKF